ncbi:hypothetical protein [Micromonospora profundi]|uniref:hypothetical protein n=1 Tax=Micromonospora profundi TaxID=1420889 RepID=UPI00368BE7A1
MAVEVLLQSGSDGDGDCPVLEDGPCVVVFHDNYVVDSSGASEIAFPWRPDSGKVGWYSLVVYDEKSGQTRQVKNAFQVY